MARVIDLPADQRTQRRSAEIASLLADAHACVDQGLLRPAVTVLGVAYEFAVEEVPPQDPAPWEEQTPPLGRLLRGTPDRDPRVVVYRRPIEARAHDDADLAEIVREVVTEQVAALLGVPPHEIDPDRDPDA